MSKFAHIVSYCVRTVTEWSKKESQPRYVNTLTQCAAHGKSFKQAIQMKLNHGISSKYSEEVPIHIEFHNVPVQVNRFLILMSSILFYLHPHFLCLPLLCFFLFPVSTYVFNNFLTTSRPDSAVLFK